MAENASTIWADGPSSSPLKPQKAQIRAWGSELEQRTGKFIFDTKAQVSLATIPDEITSVETRGASTAGDGLAAVYLSTNTGSSDTVTSLNGRVFYRSLDVGAARFNKDASIGLLKNKPTPFNRNYIQNNAGASGTFAVKLKVPAFTNARGTQGATWVEAKAQFYSTWNRANGDGTERQNIVRHDGAGNVLDYSATLSAGSSNPQFDLHHGQDLDHAYPGGVFKLVTAARGGRGACVFEPVVAIANNWLPTNYQSWILQPPEVTSGTVKLSVDKKYLIKTGGLLANGKKNIRIYDFAKLLAGPDGDRQSECLWEMEQPDLGGNPGQSLWMLDGILYILNGTQAIGAETRITAIDIASKTILGEPLILTTGKDLALAQNLGAGTKCEPEGGFVDQPQAGGPLQFWLVMGMDNADGTGISTFAMPVFQRDIGAVSANGNRSPLDMALFLAGGTHKVVTPKEEGLTFSYVERSVEGAVEKVYRGFDIVGDAQIKEFFREADGVTQHDLWTIDRVIPPH